MPLSFYAAFLGTFISIVCLSRIAWVGYDKRLPRTLSELAAAEVKLLNQFRVVLWICASLFAVTCMFFIVPKIAHEVPIAIILGTMLTTIYLLAVFPAAGKTFTLHLALAVLMGASMVAAAYGFWLALPGVYALVELGLAIVLTVLALLTIVDKKRFLFYELPLIFLSHCSILVAALALR